MIKEKPRKIQYFEILQLGLLKWAPLEIWLMITEMKYDAEKREYEEWLWSEENDLFTIIHKLRNQKQIFTSDTYGGIFANKVSILIADSTIEKDRSLDYYTFAKGIYCIFKEMGWWLSQSEKNAIARSSRGEDREHTQLTGAPYIYRNLKSKLYSLWVDQYLTFSLDDETNRYLFDTMMLISLLEDPESGESFYCGPHKNFESYCFQPKQWIDNNIRFLRNGKYVYLNTNECYKNPFINYDHLCEMSKQKPVSSPLGLH